MCCLFSVVVVTETTVVMISQFHLVSNNKRFRVVHVQIEFLKITMELQIEPSEFVEMND